MFSFFPHLQKTDPERRAHINKLRKLFVDEVDHRLFDHLYLTLTILDAKSSSLLVFNGILIAVFAVFAPADMPPKDRVILYFGMASILISCALLLLVVLVRWTSNRDLEEKEHYSSLLLKIRNSRTMKYSWAWYFSIFAMMGLCAFIIVHTNADERKAVPSSPPTIIER